MAPQMETKLIFPGLFSTSMIMGGRVSGGVYHVFSKCVPVESQIGHDPNSTCTCVFFNFGRVEILMGIPKFPENMRISPQLIFFPRHIRLIWRSLFLPLFNGMSKQPLCFV